MLYPNDEPEAGKTAAAHAAVLLRLVLAAGHDPPAPDARQAARRVRRVLGRAAQRHAPVDRRRRADAAARRRAPDGLGSRPGRSPQRTCGYTNHTLLAEALEKWPLPLFSALLPRHLEIIYEINRRFLDDVRWRLSGRRGAGPARCRSSTKRASGTCAWPTSPRSAVTRSTAWPRSTRSCSSRRAARLLRGLRRSKFLNMTNGVTPRRWMALSNPRLAALISRHIGDRWISDLDDELARLEPLAADRGFQREWRAVKAANKRTLAALIQDRTGIVVDPESMFDVQVKRLHEYKRQHLNALHLVTLYHRLQARPGTASMPRTVIFGGKAAPGYRMAKLIIRLINGVARRGQRRSRRCPGRCASCSCPTSTSRPASASIPRADLSEQISTAGKEASGTGNMKFAMNGALTIGTLDGANVEIRDAVGHENFFLFGLTAEEVVAQEGRRLPAARYLRVRTRSCGRRSTRSPAGCSRTATPSCSGRSSTRCSTTTSTCCSPTTRPTWTPSSARARPTATGRTGRACPFSTRHGSGASRRIVRSRTIAVRSGMSHRRGPGANHDDARSPVR